jgi:hypothetical protein
MKTGQIIYNSPKIYDVQAKSRNFTPLNIIIIEINEGE